MHDLKDPDRPETWLWLLHLTWRSDTSETVPSPKEIHSLWQRYASKLAEPFRAIFQSVPEDKEAWCERLSHWPTRVWDDPIGRVTLAGDAAHPMTFRKSILWSPRATTDQITIQTAGKVSTTQSTMLLTFAMQSKIIAGTEQL